MVKLKNYHLLSLILSKLFLFILLIFSFSAHSQSTGNNQITILYDAFGEESELRKDWGFSAFIEVLGKRILFDAGNNAEIFAHNVNTKNIDLTDLDFAVVSHRHGDHMGGLSHLIKVNPDVKIYVPKENFGVFGASLPGSFYRKQIHLEHYMRYFDGKPPKTMHFGTPWPKGKFTLVKETIEIAPRFHLIHLHGDWGVDLAVKEISLAIDTPQGIVLVVGCSHPRIEKILETATNVINKPIHLVIGGLHLLPADDQEINRIAHALKNEWSIQNLAAGHCTGEPAFKVLRDTFNKNYIYAGLGSVIPVHITQQAFHFEIEQAYCQTQTFPNDFWLTR